MSSIDLICRRLVWRLMIFVMRWIIYFIIAFTVASIAWAAFIVWLIKFIG